MRGCSFHLSNEQIESLLAWLARGRPDPMPERRQIMDEHAAKRDRDDKARIRRYVNGVEQPLEAHS
ncbi:hypothetical protein BST21_21860 [Mycolicibacterium celeriflavum]|nr:hypothetical protein BST21_21860 [Mycolicibacterium celeriflavum]